MGTMGQGSNVNEQELEYAWAAGFIEADGCIHLSRKDNGRAMVIIVQRDLQPIQRLRRIFDHTSHVGIVTRHGGTAQYYRVVFHSQRAIEVLEKILPYLDYKRAYAELALELLHRRIAWDRAYGRGRGHVVSETEKAARFALVDRSRLIQAERLSELAPAENAG
jgi:hypothetical protein